MGDRNLTETDHYLILAFIILVLLFIFMVATFDNSPKDQNLDLDFNMSINPSANHVLLDITEDEIYYSQDCDFKFDISKTKLTDNIGEALIKQKEEQCGTNR